MVSFLFGVMQWNTEENLVISAEDHRKKLMRNSIGM